MLREPKVVWKGTSMLKNTVTVLETLLEQVACSPGRQGKESASLNTNY